MLNSTEDRREKDGRMLTLITVFVVLIDEEGDLLIVFTLHWTVVIS